MWKSKVGFWLERSLTPCHGRSGRSVRWTIPARKGSPSGGRARRSYDAQVRIQIKVALSDCTNRDPDRGRSPCLLGPSPAKPVLDSSLEKSLRRIASKNLHKL